MSPSGQVMACHLYGTKPLPEPVLIYCQLDPWQQTPVTFKLKYKLFVLIRYIWKHQLENIVYRVLAFLFRSQFVKANIFLNVNFLVL